MSTILPFPGSVPPSGGGDRPPEPPREPEESLYDYMKRVASANEREIDRLNLGVAVLGATISNTSRVIALRFRQVIYLETVAASLILGAVMVSSGTSATLQIATLILTPLMLVGGGMGFLTYAYPAEKLVRKLADWWRS